MSVVGASGGRFPPPPPLRTARLPGAQGAGSRFDDNPTTRIKRDGLTDIDLVLVIDDSGSTFGTDPGNHRYVAARRLVRALARSGGWGRYLRLRHRSHLSRLDRAVISRSAWAHDRVGLVCFTGHVTRSAPLAAVPECFDELLEFLAGPGPSGGTALAPAVRGAGRLLSAGEPVGSRQRRKVVALFTDGQVFDEPSDLAAACRTLRADSIHLISLGGGHLPAGLAEIEGIRSVPLADLRDPRGLEHLLARALED